jgi:hypothetical protein
MPGAGATDPVDLQAHARAQLGLSRELEQARRVTPHPSLGGGGCQKSSFGTQAWCGRAPCTSGRWQFIGDKGFRGKGFAYFKYLL